MAREIPLTRGLVAIVDDEDCGWLSQWKWRAGDGRNTQYVVRSRPIAALSGRLVYSMHRLILDPPPGLFVDHIDGDGLNNRRANLRAVNRIQNSANVHARRAASGYLGVYWNAPSASWQAQIKSAERRITIGYFADPKAAALARDQAARLIHGEFANLNFPEVTDHAA